MSYEGYSQYICENGHYTTTDAHDEPWDIRTIKCPICQGKVIWRNMVNLTNGSFDEETGVRIDGYIEPEIESQKKCEHCGSVLETKYKKPKGRNCI